MQDQYVMENSIDIAFVLVAISSMNDFLPNVRSNIWSIIQSLQAKTTDIHFASIRSSCYDNTMTPLITGFTRSTDILDTPITNNVLSGQQFHGFDPNRLRKRDFVSFSHGVLFFLLIFQMWHHVQHLTCNGEHR